jgi:hypothetical protein
MGERTGDPRSLVRDKVEAIVTAGRDVRREVATLIAETAERFHLGGEGLVGLSRSVLDGTAQAIAKSVPEDPANVLRQVVDGLGDGFATAAQATRLAVEEAKGKGEAFAQDDVKRVAQDLETIGKMFVETVGDAAQKVGGHVASQAGNLREHARRTVDRVKPSLESAISAARKDPIGLGKAGLGAGARVTKHASGALFETIGRLMQDVGKRLSG